MNKLLSGRWHILAAALAVLFAFVGAALSGQWQAKTMSGTGLGLYVAPGDTLTAGYAEAGTATVDTAAGVTLDFGRAWLDTINGEPYPPPCALPDTLSPDSGLWIGPGSPEEGYGWGIHLPYVNWMAKGLLELTHTDDGYAMPAGSPYLWANLFSYSQFDEWAGSPKASYGNEGLYVHAGFSGWSEDTCRVGTLVGAEIEAHYTDNTGGGMKIGTSNAMKGAWGLMTELAMWNVDSLWTGSDGSGGILCEVRVPTGMKSNGRVQGLYVNAYGGSAIDSLVQIYLTNGTGVDYGIIQKSAAPNVLAGSLDTPHLLADSIATSATPVQHAYLDALRGKQVYLQDDATGADISMPSESSWSYGLISAEQDKSVPRMRSDGSWWSTLYMYAEVPDTLDVFSWVYGIENYVDVYRAYADSTRLGAAYGTWNQLEVWATNGPNGPSINLGDSDNHAENWASWNDFHVYVDSMYSYKDGSGAVCARLYFAGTMDTSWQRLMGVQILMEPHSTATTDSLISLYIDEDSQFGGTVDYGIMQQGDAPNILGGNLTIDVDGTRTEGDHHLELKNGTAYSEVDAGETQFAASSSAHLKDLGAALSDQEAAHLLAIFADSLTVRRWRWKQDDAGLTDAIARAWDAATDGAVSERVQREMRSKRYRTLDVAQRDSTARGLHKEWKAAALFAAKQREERLRRREAERAAVEHVGPTAQDSYRLSRVVNPAGADSSVRQGGDEQVALMLAVGYLARGNRALQERLTKAEGDLAYLAVRVRALEALASFDK